MYKKRNNYQIIIIIYNITLIQNWLSSEAAEIRLLHSHSADIKTSQVEGNTNFINSCTETVEAPEKAEVCPSWLYLST